MLKIKWMPTDEAGNVLFNETVATADTYTAAQMRRREEGIRRALVHGMPITLDLYEVIDSEAVDGLAESVEVFVNSLTTTVVFELSESQDHDDRD